MRKNEKADHQQRLINSYNARLDQIEDKLGTDLGPIERLMLVKAKNNVLSRLSKLYGTEKYGMV